MEDTRTSLSTILQFFQGTIVEVLKTTFRPKFFIFEFYLPSHAGSRTMMVHGSTTVLTLRKE